VADRFQPCLVILTGPPGSGKTTVARALAEAAETPTVHLHTDDFFAAIRRGFIAPWLPESSGQNMVISQAIAAAAAAFARGGYGVIVDGVVGPWHLDPYRVEASRAGVPLDYVVLRLERSVAIARARDREIGPLAEYPPNIFEGFADLGPLESHVIALGDMGVDEVAEAVRLGMADARFRLGDLAR